MKGYYASAFVFTAVTALCACSRREAAPVPPAPAAAPQAFTLSAAAFLPGGDIPPGFTCDGANARPELSWSGVPAAARSLALVVRDPDAPSGHFLHWAVLDMPPSQAGLPASWKAQPPAKELLNDAGAEGYTGPCPPSGRHRYIFTLYALDAAAPAAEGAGIEAALAPHVLARAGLTGFYQRKK